MSKFWKEVYTFDCMSDEDKVTFLELLRTLKDFEVPDETPSPGEMMNLIRESDVYGFRGVLPDYNTQLWRTGGKSKI